MSCTCTAVITGPCELPALLSALRAALAASPVHLFCPPQYEEPFLRELPPGNRLVLSFADNPDWDNCDRLFTPEGAAYMAHLAGAVRLLLASGCRAELFAAEISGAALADFSALTVSPEELNDRLTALCHRRKPGFCIRFILQNDRLIREVPMPSIAPNLLRGLFRRVYFVNGTAYAGKSTLVRTLAEKHHGIMCGENYHDALTDLTDPEHQPNLRYFDTMSGWQEFLSRTPEVYAAWIDGVNREAADLELLLLIHLAQMNRPVFVDTNIPLDVLHEIGANVLVMLSPQHMSVERFFDRPDPEKQFLLRQLEAFPDPEAAKANFRACLARLNSPECYAAFEHSGFPVWIRREDSTPEEAVAFAEEVFGLTPPRS